MSKVQQPWQAEQVARLRQGFADGDTWSTVAVDLGRTRNSVIGKAHRLCLFRGGASTGKHWRQRSPTVPMVAVPKPPPPPKPPPKQIDPWLEPIKPKPPPPEPQMRKPVVYQPVDIVSLRSNHCRWPLWDIGSAERLYCGRATALAPYCRQHATVAYSLKHQARNDDRRHLAVPRAEPTESTDIAGRREIAARRYYPA